MGDLLDLPEGIALARLQELLTAALGDKQSVAFAGEVTVMKLIGG
jgi:cyclic pyranopterin phosphate synthase